MPFMRHRVARNCPGCGIESADPSSFGIDTGERVGL